MLLRKMLRFVDPLQPKDGPYQGQLLAIDQLTSVTQCTETDPEKHVRCFQSVASSGTFFFSGPETRKHGALARCGSKGRGPSWAGGISPVSYVEGA